MWKRFQSSGREKEKQIGNPVLVETTYDEDQLRHIPSVSDAQNANYQPNAQSPGAAPPSFTNKDSNTLSPHDPHEYRASEIPTVSSIYSQPSPEIRFDYNRQPSPGDDFRDVSPPSSPEPEQDRFPNQPRRFRSMRDVSPVDENRGQDRDAAQTTSNIPVLRKAPPSLRGSQSQTTQKFWGGKVAPNSKVRWDEYSGEPTSGSTGKAGQVSPGSYIPPSSERRPMGYHVSVSGPQDHLKKSTASERGNRFGTKTPPMDTTVKPREPWKGASGRAQIVQPLKDQRAKQPLNLERKREFRKSVVPGDAVSNSSTDTARRTPAGADTTPVAESREELDGLDTQDDPIKPIVPLKVGKNSPPRTLTSPISPRDLANQAPYSYPSPITPTNNQPLSPTGNKQEGSKADSSQYSTPSNTKVVRKSTEGTPRSTSSHDNGPVSRFSWTTYNTNTTYQQSPPPSPPPPLPTQDPIPVARSILNRRRPIPSSDKATIRKPVTPTTARPHIMVSDPPSPRPDSTFSTNTQKALPRPPTELSAADHIDILEAQMSDLRLRRSNVNRLLQDLNKQAPPNPMLTDFRRMRLVEQRKKDFEYELAEIRREEHDVGLKLHRAWRKRERDDPNGSESAIWIRRVTR
ncbi:hypothetical protein CC78DRAFT_544663 [Lojkania enalia]|uniref:Uncharacterized protein n=1 Tax=Lojkania enalia TaxID=147567 RepID=A0A9P4N2T6_9PLEO|nr:hypothetical protein CC78DRAFT_544663 [Didymosphaeria enalia]